MIVCSEVEKKIDSTFSVGPLTLTVEPGIVTALVGSNGSGKAHYYGSFQALFNLIKVQYPVFKERKRTGARK